MNEVETNRMSFNCTFVNLFIGDMCIKCKVGIESFLTRMWLNWYVETCGFSERD